MIATPLDANPSHETNAPPITSTTSAPGTRRANRPTSTSTASRTTPSTIVRHCASPTSVMICHSVPSVPSVWTEIPKSLGSWLTMMITATPFRNPSSTGREKKSAKNPSRNTPARIRTAPVSSAAIAASTAKSGGALRRQRRQRDRGQDRQPGLRPHHQPPRAGEQRIQDQRRQRPVQARDRGQPGKLPVRQRLRHQHRAHRHCGHYVAHQPSPPIGAEHTDDRQPPLHTHRQATTLIDPAAIVMDFAHSQTSESRGRPGVSGAAWSGECAGFGLRAQPSGV